MKRKPTIRNRPKHQHWVPQFYLRYYATPESRTSKQPKVWIFSKDEGDGDEKLTSVRNVCGQRYLYSPMLETGDRDWALDDLLNELESGLGSIWPALVERYVALDDPHVRRAVALFVAVTHLRNPDVRAQVERMHTTLVKIYEDAPILADGTPDIEGIEINGKYHPVSTDGWHRYRALGKDDHDRFFADIVRSEAIRTAQHLMEKRWSVVLAEEDTFITTDKPVGLQHEAREKFGMQTEGTIVTFPLSPGDSLFLTICMRSPPTSTIRWRRELDQRSISRYGGAPVVFSSLDARFPWCWRKCCRWIPIPTCPDFGQSCLTPSVMLPEQLDGLAKTKRRMSASARSLPLRGCSAVHFGLSRRLVAVSAKPQAGCIGIRL